MKKMKKLTKTDEERLKQYLLGHGTEMLDIARQLYTLGEDWSEVNVYEPEELIEQKIQNPETARELIRAIVMGTVNDGYSNYWRYDSYCNIETITERGLIREIAHNIDYLVDDMIKCIEELNLPYEVKIILGIS